MSSGLIIGGFGFSAAVAGEAVLSAANARTEGRDRGRCMVEFRRRAQVSEGARSATLCSVVEPLRGSCRVFYPEGVAQRSTGSRFAHPVRARTLGTPTQ